MDRGEARLAALVRTHREKERKRIRMRDGKTGLAYRMVEREARRRTLRARAFRDLVREMVGKEKLLKKAMQDLALKLRKKELSKLNQPKPLPLPAPPEAAVPPPAPSQGSLPPPAPPAGPPPLPAPPQGAAAASAGEPPYQPRIPANPAVDKWTDYDFGAPPWRNPFSKPCERNRMRALDLARASFASDPLRPFRNMTFSVHLHWASLVKWVAQGAKPSAGTKFSRPVGIAFKQQLDDMKKSPQAFREYWGQAYRHCFKDGISRAEAMRAP